MENEMNAKHFTKHFKMFAFGLISLKAATQSFSTLHPCLFLTLIRSLSLSFWQCEQNTNNNKDCSIAIAQKTNTTNSAQCCEIQLKSH